jgi:hypothetical protein
MDITKGTQMSVRKRTDSYIVDDMWIYLEGVEVVSSDETKEEREKFKQGKNPRLDFEEDLDDFKSNSSVKVLGFTKKFFGVNSYFLGYLPKEVARAILAGGFFDNVMPSPPRFRQNNRISFDLVGSSEEADNFKAFFQQILMDVGFVR